MSPHGAIEELLSSSQPWSIIDQLSKAWSDELARECEARFEFAGDEGRPRLLWLLDRANTASAHEALLRLLRGAYDEDASRILGALIKARVGIPADQFPRLFKIHAQKAVAAAGFSEDEVLVPKLAELLTDPELRRHAALALANLGRKEFAAEIASRIGEVQGVDVTGFAAALEIMNEPAVVPQMIEHLANPNVLEKWDIQHALWRLTGREPFVDLHAQPDESAKAVSDFWQTFSPGVFARPRIERLEVDDASRSASFDLVDGAGTLRIDYAPPQPGSDVFRGDKWLYAGATPLYDVGPDSVCGTCETILRLIGWAPENASHEAAEIRSTVSDLSQVDAGVLDALGSYVLSMRTGHYVAQLVDRIVERVTEPEQSMLTAWPGTDHFQASKAPTSEGPTSNIVLPTASLSALNPDTIERHVAAIASGAHPTALVMTWLEQRNLGDEVTETFAVSVILDGHHKLAAYAKMGKPARILSFARLEHSSVLFSEWRL